MTTALIPSKRWGPVLKSSISDQCSQPLIDAIKGDVAANIASRTQAVLVTDPFRFSDTVGFVKQGFYVIEYGTAVARIEITRDNASWKSFAELISNASFGNRFGQKDLRKG